MRFGTCTASFASMTLAMKAQRALSHAAIRSEVVKLDSSRFARGCAYGLEFSCAQSNNVRTILDNARIPVKNYLDGDGTP